MGGILRKSRLGLRVGAFVSALLLSLTLGTATLPVCEFESDSEALRAHLQSEHRPNQERRWKAQRPKLSVHARFPHANDVVAQTPALDHPTGSDFISRFRPLRC